MTEDFTRRRLFGLAGASVAGAAGLSLSGCSRAVEADPTLATQAADASAGFVSRPDLTPPRITVKRYAGLGADSEYIFLNAPFSGPGHGGTIILNSRGDFVWFGPNTAAHHHMNFSVQTYKNQPVLTWWQGQIVEGFGEGDLVIADSSYKIQHTIRAVGGQLADFHEFYITPQNTALISIYRRYAGVDLRAVHGQANGYLVSGVVQEIDIATGKLLWEWDSWDHAHPQVALTETYQQFGVGDGGNGTRATPFNYFHINSLAIDSDGDVLISGRNTCAIYKVSRQTSKIVWRLNGKKSDFTMGPRSKFWWQHHVRPQGDGRLTVFDNAANGPTVNEKQSRALILSVDTATMHVSLKKQYIHPRQQLVAGAMGSAQLLGDDRMFVGWGTEPYFSEFSPQGRLLMDGIIETGDSSYRAFSQSWSGQPADQPAAAARHRTGGATVYASWNGATDVRSWAVLAGPTRTSLTSVGTASKTGFETAISVPSKGPYFAVQARNAKGQVLSKSAVVKIS